MTVACIDRFVEKSEQTYGKKIIQQ